MQMIFSQRNSKVITPFSLKLLTALPKLLINLPRIPPDQIILDN